MLMMEYACLSDCLFLSRKPAGICRITGSADLLAADWEGGLPGTLAAGRRPSFGLNFVAAVGQDSMAQVVGGLMSSYEGK